MAKSGRQTETGKAFEYACAYAVYDKYNSIIDVNLENSPQMSTAKFYYACLNDPEKMNYLKGARAALRIIERLEPKLTDDQSPLTLILQTDSKGIAGDVRDVLCVRRGWQIGLSCKHNHQAIKHSRLSDSIDFGKEWFGKGCSDEYFKSVRKVFSPLREIREKSLKEGNPALWSQIEDKEKSCYEPVLEAFMQELRYIDVQYPGEIPALLIRYLIGTNDFYKVIMNDKKRYTQIESVNINGTLNQPLGKKRALIDVPVMKLPTKFYEIGFKIGSRNTIVVVCDEG